MHISYSQLKNKLCPIRHYFTINQKCAEVIKPITIGNIVHKVYADVLKTRSYKNIVPDFIKNELEKEDKYSPHIENNIKKHIHKGILKKIPKKAILEKKLIVSTNKLPYLDEIVHIYCKPDIYYIQDDVSTICEIKTNAYNKYDPLQLTFYAWAVSLHNQNVKHFVHKVYYTATNQIQVVELVEKEEIQDRIDRYFYSACKAYSTLHISTLVESIPLLATLISTDSKQLTSLFNIIHPEQCLSCNSSIICPAYCKEVTATFECKVATNTSSDILVFIN